MKVKQTIFLPLHSSHVPFVTLFICSSLFVFPSLWPLGNLTLDENVSVQWHLRPIPTALRGQRSVCVFLVCVFGRRRFMNTLSACANDSTWWSCIWSIISEGRKYSTDTDEGLSHVINLWWCTHMCQVVRWKHFINVLIRLLIRLIASINTGGAATLCTDRLNMDMCAFMHYHV